MRTEDAIPDQLAHALKLVNELPPLSPLTRHLLGTITSPGEGPPLREVSNWIEKDALTSGRVLALANSALYSRTIPILSIRLAVSRLGLNPLRNLILSMSMKSMWSSLPTPAQWSSTRFNTHSIACALLSEMVASVLEPQDMGLAFLAGLLHDAGRLVIAVLLHDDAALLERLTRDEHHGLEETERELVGFTHSQASAAIVRLWNLPELVQAAVLFHENPVALPSESPAFLLTDIVHAADCYVDCKGFSISGVDRQPEDHPLNAKLGMHPESHLVFAQFHEELDILLKIL